MQLQSKQLDSQLIQTAKQAIQSIKETENNPKWQQFAEKPCTMLKMEVQGRAASRGQIVVNFPIKQVFNFLSTNGTIKKLNPKLITFNILHEVKDTDYQNPVFVNYMEYSGVWPVANRDFVNIKVSEEGDQKCYIASRFCEYPFEEKKGVVRGKLYSGGYILQKIDQNSTMIIYISDADICGSIPGILKKQLAKNQGSLVASIQPTMQKQQAMKQQD